MILPLDVYEKDFLESVKKGDLPPPPYYNLVNGELIPFTEKEMLESENSKDYAENQIKQLKLYLDSTDWVCSKIVEDNSVRSKYADVLEERKISREKINELEKYL